MGAGREHAYRGKRAYRRRKGLPAWRACRYADDFVVLVHGSRADTEALREEVAQVLAPVGLRLPAGKTRIVHLSGGLDSLGFHIRWSRKRGSDKWFVYTFIADRPLRSLKAKIRALTRCGENRTAGSARGPGKRIRSNPDTAPRAYSAQLLMMEVHLMRSTEMGGIAADHVVSGDSGWDRLDGQLLDQVVGQARERGISPADEGGLLQQSTKRLPESALEGEITDHLGYDKHDPAGDNSCVA